MKQVVIVLLVLTPALAGCTGGTDDAFERDAGDAATDRPALPEGLAMDGAQTVSYNESTIIWEWSGSLGPHVWTPPTGRVGGAAATSFDLPSAVGVALHARLEWEDNGADHLGVLFRGPDGRVLCSDWRDFPWDPVEATCASPLYTPDERKRATVEVDAYNSPDDEIPFTLRLIMTIGSVSEGPARPVQPDSRTLEHSMAAHHVVIGFTDSGINPYHEAFRDSSTEANLHPSNYLEGYPEDAVALNLSLDAPTYLDAIAADAQVWAEVEPHRLYWIPGTRIVGAILEEESLLETTFACRPILDCYGHGTWVTSQGAGSSVSLCPDCKIVAVQGYEPGLPWLADQAWVDVSSNSWLGQQYENHVGQRADHDRVIARKPTFFSAGNGLAGQFGVAGTPSAVWSYQGAPHTIAVGGHQNGEATTAYGSMPQIAADACVDAAEPGSIDGSTMVAGSSLTAPYAAGAAAQLVVEARRILGDNVSGIRGSVLAEGPEGLLDEGPLHDGTFTTDELKEVLLKTADPRPEKQNGDEEPCYDLDNPLTLLFPSLVPWSDVPEEVPQYYFMGYGAITNQSLQHGIQVLAGEAKMPERLVEDAFFTLDQEVRKALVETDP